MKIDLFILDYNPLDFEEANKALRETVLAFQERHSKNIEYNVTIIDQCSTDKHSDFIEELRRSLSCSRIRLNKSLGISRAMNMIANISRTKYFALLTSDVIMTTGCDDDMVAKLDQSDDLVSICPMANYSWSPHLQRKAIGSSFGEDDVTFIDQGGGLIRTMCTELTFNFFRRSAFDKIGYFDERWKAGYENGDWGTRAFLAGLTTGISLDSFIWHYLSMAHKSLGTLKTYDGYINMGTEHTHVPLRKMWDEKWPHYTDHFPIWDCVILNGLTVERCPEMLRAFKHNIYLPFIQEVGY